MTYDNTQRVGNVILDYTYYCGEDLYTEGAIEDRLLDYVKNNPPLDYERYITVSRSWSVMYHLSHIRENVARWLPINASDSVLEIGSGCGAITGALARLAGFVTCVELSKKRSLINAYKNKENDNIKIMVGNFEDVEKGLQEKFDYITLIGVLEYAQSYITDEMPYNRFLEVLKGHLKPGGKIVIAIENRLGMKYFAGCKEDHLGTYFGGIEGYGPTSGVKTFSKESLTGLLEECGFCDSRFYYPYPDYKLPHTIYSDERLPGKGDLSTNLRNYDADRLLLFDESKAFDSMIAEDRFPEFSNSFIVLASPEKGWQEGIRLPIYAKYSNERTEDYRVCTLIYREGNGEKEVVKSALSTHANQHIDHLSESFSTLVGTFADTGLVPVGCRLIKGVERMMFAGVASTAKNSVIFDYVTGVSIEDHLNTLEEQMKYEEMEKFIALYSEKLLSCQNVSEFRRSAAFDEIFGKREFKKKYVAAEPCDLDMIFSNIVLDKDDPEGGKWIVLDYEWVLDCAVPIQFVIFRALYYHFRNKEDSGFALYLSRKGMDVYSLCGIDKGERMLFEQMEHSFQIYITGGSASLQMMQVLMPTATIRIDNIVKMGSYLRNLDTPTIYFSRGTNFSPENQISIIADVDDGHVQLKIPFDRYINSVRIDPTEYPCLLHIEKLCYVLSDGISHDVKKIMVNGYKLTEDSYVFDTNDAQIVIQGVPQNAKALEAEYNVSMVEDPFYEDMLKVLKNRDRAERERKKTIRYRLMRKIGLTGRDDAPDGYVTADLTVRGR